MDAADLDHQARTRSDCIPPELVARLLERGHAAVVEQQAGRGEWFCAREWARLSGERGRQAEALDVLAPYLATGWWTATVAAAELLEGWGRAEEAIELTRARMATGHPTALETYTRLLARNGRAPEAFALLVPHVDDPELAAALVDVAGAAGRDEEAAALLVARLRAGRRCSDFPWCCRGFHPDTALGLLATIRERQGRTDQAIALLRRRESPLHEDGRLADLLARHGRIEELRAHAAVDGHDRAARRLAELLEERGDVAGAIAVYGRADGPAARHPGPAFDLALLLARHGQGGEAIAVLRTRADAHPGDECALHALSDLCLRHGRPEDGLAHLDALATARGGEEEWDLHRIRLPLLAARDGVDEAVARARTHPEGDTPYAARDIAELLAGAGRVEEAVAALAPHAAENRHDLAGHLVDLGRVEEALALVQHTRPRPPVVPTIHLWSDEPRFRRSARLGADQRL